MKTILLLVSSFLFIDGFSFAQSHPVPVRSDISIKRIMTVHNYSTRLARDPVTKNLFYSLANGNIYKVIRPLKAAAYDTLIYSTASHGVDYPQCIAFYDSILY